MPLPALILLLHAAAPIATPTVCPVTPVIPAELAGWSKRTPIAAGRTAATATAIIVGQGAQATFSPAAAVTPPAPTAKPVATNSSAGLLAFTAPAAGRYRVALGAAAWVEVVAGGKALTAVAHGHGPACSPVRKMVDFDLPAERYLLQLSGSPTSTLGIMVARLR